MTNRKKILIIDDSLNIRKLIKVIINKLGDYEYLEAANGEEGLEKAIRYHPDLIVSELILNGIDGVELCREVKSRVETPIIVLTSQTSALAVEQAREAGADIFVGKPFELVDLRDSVSKLIGIDSDSNNVAPRVMADRS